MLKRRIVHISFPWLVPKLVRKTNAKQNSSCVFRGPDNKQNTVGGLLMRIQAFICITRFILTFLEKGWLFKNSKCTLWIFNFFFSYNLYSMLTYYFTSQIPTLMIGSHNTYVMKFNNSIKKLLQPINVAEEAQYPIFILFLLLQIQTQKEKQQILLHSHFFNCLLSLCYIFSVFCPLLFHLSMLLQNSSMCYDFFHTHESVYLVPTFKHCSGFQVLVTPMQHWSEAWWLYKNCCNQLIVKASEWSCDLTDT
jgi:hypothetical protein